MTVHVRKICHTCTTVTCCNVHIVTKYSIFNSTLIHYLVVVVINFVIYLILYLVVIIYFYVTCRGIGKFPEQNPIDSETVLQTILIDHIHYDVLL